jgi:hypothetical protein
MLSKPPLSLKIDKSFIEQLAADLGRMAVAGLNSATIEAEQHS